MGNPSFCVVGLFFFELQRLRKKTPGYTPGVFALNNCFFKMLKGKLNHFVAKLLVCLSCTFGKPVPDIVDSVELHGIGVKGHEDRTLILSCVVIACRLLHLGTHGRNNLYAAEANKELGQKMVDLSLEYLEKKIV